MDSLSVPKLGKTLSEFEDLDRLEADSLSIQTLVSGTRSENELQQLLEKRIEGAIGSVAESLLSSLRISESAEQIGTILQNITTDSLSTN